MLIGLGAAFFLGRRFGLDEARTAQESANVAALKEASDHLEDARRRFEANAKDAELRIAQAKEAHKAIEAERQKLVAGFDANDIAGSLKRWGDMNAKLTADLAELSAPFVAPAPASPPVSTAAPTTAPSGKGSA